MKMDPPLINESSFSTVNASSYSLAEIWPSSITGGGLGLKMRVLGSELPETVGNRDGSAEESTVTEQSGGGKGGKKRKKSFASEDESSKIVPTTSSGNDFNKSSGKQIEVAGHKREILKSDLEASSAGGGKLFEPTENTNPLKDYIHVRARRGQATDSHSLAERARREKISERMNVLQDLVPGCKKVIGKAHVLDEIINYVQSLQRQVEFLSMKLETVNSRVNISPAVESFHSKEFGAQMFDPTGKMFRQRAASAEYAQGSQHDWFHMQEDCKLITSIQTY